MTRRSACARACSIDRDASNACRSNQPWRPWSPVTFTHRWQVAAV